MARPAYAPSASMLGEAAPDTLEGNGTEEAELFLPHPRVIERAAQSLFRREVPTIDVRRIIRVFGQAFADVHAAINESEGSKRAVRRPAVLAYLAALDEALRSASGAKPALDDSVAEAYDAALEELAADLPAKVPTLSCTDFRNEVQGLVTAYRFFIFGFLNEEDPSAEEFIELWTAKLEGASNPSTERSRMANRCREDLAYELSELIPATISSWRDKRSHAHIEALAAPQSPYQLRDVPIAELKIDDTQIDEAWIDQMVESLGDLGILAPVVLGPNDVVISGRGRIAAHIRAGRSHVPALLRPDLVGDLAELARIDENLVRRSPNLIERAELLTSRKRVYEKIHPQTAHGKASPLASTDAQRASFAANSARWTGASKRSVQEAVQIASNISPQARDLLRSTPLANRTKDLLCVSRLDAAEQVRIATVVREGKANTLASAKKILATDSDESAEPQDLTGEDAFEPADVRLRESATVNLHGRGRSRFAKIRVQGSVVRLTVRGSVLEWEPLETTIGTESR